MESAASIEASTAVLEHGQFAVGVNNNTDFLRAMTGRIDVVAEPIQQGRTQQLWQVLLTRAVDGKLVARGQVRLQNVKLPGGSWCLSPICRRRLTHKTAGSSVVSVLARSFRSMTPGTRSPSDR